VRRVFDPWLAYYPFRLYFRLGDWLLFQWWWYSRPFMWALERRAIEAGLLTVEQAEAAVFGEGAGRSLDAAQPEPEGRPSVGRAR
jgi:hypothetical protein